ncbi:MAG: (2Fe-2S)-binding protein [Gemmatimonadaceae bacterium]
MLIVNGRTTRVRPGTTVAAALVSLDALAFRMSASGEPRGPLCGMGTCHECRVAIDGVPHRRACLVAVAEGMRVTTDA